MPLFYSTLTEAKQQSTRNRALPLALGSGLDLKKGKQLLKSKLQSLQVESLSDLNKVTQFSLSFACPCSLCPSSFRTLV